jgi:hypothetical protein
VNFISKKIFDAGKNKGKKGEGWRVEGRRLKAEGKFVVVFNTS